MSLATVVGLLLLIAPFVQGDLVGGAILPHGDFAWDPTLVKPDTTERRAADEIAKAARYGGKWLADALDPDIIIISTPHGQELTTDFALHLNSHGSGFASIGGDMHDNRTRRKVPFPRVQLEPSMSGDLLMNLKEENLNVSGILNFADSEDTALRWGEVIPLWMIPPRDINATQQPKRRIMIWSHPLRRYSDASSMVPELLMIGNRIANWANAQKERIAMVISSDLAHTHLPSGPYGYSNSSTIFDKVLGEWAGDPVKNENNLLQIGRRLQNEAMSCGFTGIVMLHGALYGNKTSRMEYQSRLIANRNVTYYGMMVATFKALSPVFPTKATIPN